MEDKEKPKSRVGRIIRIGIICFALYAGLSMWIPGLIGFRSKEICSRVEVDAQKIAVAISDYLSASGDRDTSLTKADIENLVNVRSPWALTRCGDNLYIHVIDRTGKCPAEYQNPYPEWHSNTYTLKF